MGQNFHICLQSGPTGLTPYGQPDREKMFFKTSLIKYPKTQICTACWYFEHTKASLSNENHQIKPKVCVP